jgi:uncharacterized membrane protein YciS (DUF1049 family)
LCCALLLLAAATAQAQDGRSLTAASVVLTAGSTADLLTTLAALRQPGAYELNPLLAQGGTAGLVLGKVVTTATLLWVMRHLARQGHPTAARWIGFAGGGALGAVAVHNARQGRP